jgi:hypothetical protein
MLWPDSDNRNRDGEIDFPEMNLDSSNLFGYVHKVNATSGSDQSWSRTKVNMSDWHTAVVEWSPGVVVFRLDGVETGRTTERVPSTPMHWVLQTETALHDAAGPDSSVRGNVQIDWVAAWAYDPSSTPSSPAKDTTPPVVAVGGPANPARVVGGAPVSATASDASGIDQMKWFVDGVEVGWDGSGPTWSDTWNTRPTANGTHSLVAKARDRAGNWGTSPAVAVKVAN